MLVIGMCSLAPQAFAESEEPLSPVEEQTGEQDAVLVPDQPADTVTEETKAVTEEERINPAADVSTTGDFELLAVNSGPYQVSGLYYATLQDAIIAVGGEGQITMVDDDTLSASVTIPSGVTFVLPYDAEAENATIKSKGSNQDFANTNTNGKVTAITLPTPNSEHVMLIVPEEHSLTIADGAILAVGGTVSGNSGGNSGQTYGAYSQIELEGSLVVESGGILTSCGYITGSGQVTAQSGAAIYEPFVICDFNGGTYTAVNYLNHKHSPFLRYAMPNIQSELVMQADSTLYGYASLYADSQYNHTVTKIIGPSGALLTTNGAVVTAIYNADQTISSVSPIGHTHLAISGGKISFDSLSLKVRELVDVSTDDVDFPMPYNYTVSLEDGVAATVKKDRSLRILPGAEIEVKAGSTLTVAGTLAVYDGMEFVRYGLNALPPPDASVLEESGFSTRGCLIVDGTLNVTGTFAGLVESAGDTGKITVSSTQLTKTIADGVYSGEKAKVLGFIEVGNTTSTTNYVGKSLTAQIWTGLSSGPAALAQGTYYAYTSDAPADYTPTTYSYVTHDDNKAATEHTVDYPGSETADGAWMTEGVVTYWYDKNEDGMQDDGETTTAAIEPGKTIPKPAALTAEAGYTLSWPSETMPRQLAYTMQATATPIEYKITYSGVTSGEHDNPATYTVESETITLSDPEPREGYTFIGWMTEGVTEPQKGLQITKGSTGDRVYIANWSINSHTVTWDVDGSKTEQTYEYGAQITKPEAPAKEGYTFAGWAGYVATMPDNDVTFTSQWTVNEYQLFFNKGYQDSASDIIATWTVNYQETTTAPFPQPTRETFDLVGWYDNPQCTGAAVTSVTMGAADKTLYAKWTAKSMTITFDANGGEGTMDPQTITWDGSFYAPNNNTFTREGYIFTGWNAKADGKGTGYATGEAGKILTGTEDDLTLYAQWKGNSYPVAFYDGEKQYDNLSGNAAIGTTYQAAFGGSIPEPPAKNGYNFLNWKIGDTKITSTTAVEYAHVTDNTIKLTANWGVNTYQITWQFGNGTSDQTETLAFGAAITKPDDPTKTGYAFTGWKDQDGNSYSTGMTVPAKNVIFTARWETNTYQVTLKNNDGTDASQQFPVTFDGEYGTLPTPTRTGYQFEGWYTAAEGGTKVEVGHQVPDAVADKNGYTLYAHWEIQSFTITYHWDGNVESHKDTYQYDAQVTPYTPTKTGYTFTGWNGEIPPNMPANDLEFFAINNGDNWTVNSYIVTWMVDGESYSKQSVEYGKNYFFTGTAPTKTGYTFAGWEGCTKNSVVEVYEANAPMGAADVTHEALWTANQYTITFEANGSEGAMDKLTLTYPNSANLTKNVFAKSGNTFAGWNTQADGTGTAYADQAEISSLANDLTLYAQWTVNQYTITFDAKGGSTVASITQAFDTAVTAPAAPAKEGYRFDGWDADIPATMPANDLTINAKWTSYLELLETTDLPGQLEDAREYYAKLSTDMESTYQTDNAYKAHREALSAAIYGAVEQSLVSGAEAAEKLLADIATLKVDGHNVEVCMTTPDTLAAELLAKNFLQALLNSSDIESIQIGGDLFEKDKATQLELMLAVAYETLHDYKDYTDYLAEQTPAAEKSKETFTNWLMIRKDDLTIGVMDGTSVQITLGLQCDDGIALSNEHRQAVYTLNFFDLRHTITWKSDAKTEYSKETYNKGDSIAAPTLTKTGYTFAGWDADVPATMGKIDLTFTATWTANTYTVTFDANGGEVSLANKPVTFDSTYGELPTPTRTGYSFAGWMLGTEEVGKDTFVKTADDHTLVAQWTIGESYPITYDLAGGEFSATSEVKYNYNVETVYTLPTPSRTGYTFAGWTGTGLDKATEAVTIPAGSTGPREYTATWTVNQYTINFNTDGGSEIESITKEYKAAIGEVPTPTKIGYTFEKWEPEIPINMPANNLTITAKWKINQYTITFDADGGSAVASVTKNYNAEVGSVAAPTKTGYSFDGWDQNIPVTMPANNLTITAKWKINQYTITFETDGGSDIASITKDYNAEVGSVAVPTKTGYSFDGWDQNIPVTMPAKNLTVTAKWKINQYTITFNTAGGSAVDPITKDYNADIGDIPAPVKTGYTFNGWSPVLPAAMPAKNATHTAQWTATGDTPYQVQHYQQNVNGEGYTLFETDNPKGQADTTAFAAEKAYAGFTLNASASTTSGTITADGQLVLRLYYDRNSCQVTWNIRGTQQKSGYLYGQSLTIPADLNYQTDATDFIFTGWDKSLPETVTASATYTARYTKSYEVSVVGSTTTYRTLALALQKQTRGVLRLEKDVTLTESVTVPAKVTLVVPCKADDAGYTVHGSYKFNYDGTAGAGRGDHPNAKLFRTLTIPQGVKLTVNGSLLVNSVSGRMDRGGSEQDITGGYGQIDLAGDILVKSGGVVDCFGYIKGSGQIIVQSGGVVGDLFIVRNWRGGSHTINVLDRGDPSKRTYPMNESDCHNIQAPMKIMAGASFEALVKMYADGSYYYTRFPQINSSNGLFRQVDETGWIMRYYENGRERYEFHGSTDFSNSTLRITTTRLSTGLFLYPIDGDIDMVLHAGTYTFRNNYKFLPGSTMTAKSGAHIVIDDENYYYDPNNDLPVTVVFYDEFNDVPNILGNGVDTTYPAGRSAAALTLEDGSSLTNKSIFAGKINTTSDNIFATENATWLNVRSCEANGYYSNNTATEQYVIPLYFDLDITRPGYAYEILPNKSIRWLPLDKILPTLTLTGSTATADLRSTHAVEKTVTVYAAAYNTAGKMLEIHALGTHTIAANGTKTGLSAAFTATGIDWVQVFVMDAHHAPMGPNATKNIQ